MKIERKTHFLAFVFYYELSSMHRDASDITINFGSKSKSEPEALEAHWPEIDGQNPNKITREVNKEICQYCTN